MFKNITQSGILKRHNNFNRGRAVSRNISDIYPRKQRVLQAESNCAQGMKETEKRAFRQCAREADRLGLVRCSSGNLSEREKGDRMRISGTGVWLGQLRGSDTAVVDLSDGSFVEGCAPSGEFRLHREVYRCRPDVSVILHFQSEAATVLACLPEVPDYNVIIEVPVYLGGIGLVPFLPPGSAELAVAVAGAMKSADVVQMRNHGQVVAGSSFDDVLQKAVFFEFACSVIVKSSMKAIPLKAETLEMLYDYKKKVRWVG